MIDNLWNAWIRKPAGLGYDKFVKGYRYTRGIGRMFSFQFYNPHSRKWHSGHAYHYGVQTKSHSGKANYPVPALILEGVIKDNEVRVYHWPQGHREIYGWQVKHWHKQSDWWQDPKYPVD